MSAGRSEEAIRALRTAFEHGEIERIVSTVRKIESVCGRQRLITYRGEGDVIVEWRDGEVVFDVVLPVPGAAALAAELATHDIRLPERKEAL